MSDEGNPAPAASSVPRQSRLHLRVYFETWLLCAFLSFSCGIAFAVAEAAKQERAPEKLWSALLIAPILALLALPGLWLLRIFREAAASSWLRCLRRMLLGSICGLVPAALLVMLLAQRRATELQNLDVLWLCGLVYGAAAGLVDAMHLDVRDEAGLGP